MNETYLEEEPRVSVSTEACVIMPLVLSILDVESQVSWLSSDVSGALNKNRWLEIDKKFFLKITERNFF